MFKKTLISLAVASSLGLTGCFSGAGEGGNANPDYKISQDKNRAEFLAQFEGKTWPVFDPFPAVSDLPIPNDLIYANVGDGSFAVGDTQPPVTTALNGLSGASTVAPIDLKFSQSIDAESVVGPDLGALVRVQTAIATGGAPDSADIQAILAQNVFVIELDYASGDPLRGLRATEVPDGDLFFDFEVEVKALSGTDYVRILPTKPLDPFKRYVVALTKDILDSNGDPIVSSPAYTELKGESVLGPSVDAVRNLIKNFWEPTARSAISGLRTNFGGTAIDAENIAMAYSFTTSNDKKVLQYIANPAQWIEDQLRLSVTTEAAKRARGAHLLLLNENNVPNAPSLPATTWDMNGDGVVSKADFQPFYDIYAAQLPGILASFGFSEIEDAVALASGAFEPSSVNPALASCDAEPFVVSAEPVVTVPDKFQCAGILLKGGLQAQGITFPEPKASEPSIDFSSAMPAPAVSAVLSSIPGASNVLVAQGSITLPYFLGTPNSESGAALRTEFWKADTQLAAGLNNAFKDAGLVIPQGTGKSEVVNAVFPFPKKNADITVPMLVMYPSGANLESEDSLPVVIYQHGITTDRSAALTFGSALAANGVAVVAIDQPLHGVAPFSAEEQKALAETLLTAAGMNTEENVSAVISQTFKFGAVLQIQAQLDAANPDGAPNLGITDPNNLEQLNDAIALVLSGALDDQAPTAKPTIQSAISLENTVARAGSTIPGLAPAFTGQGLAAAGATERHFGYGTDDFNNIIKMNFDSSAAAGDSGDLFINLTNFLGSRDNLRQGSVDLMTVRASIGAIAPAFDASNVYFVGHSLGTINGGAFVASTNASGRSDLEIQAANLLTPVGGVVRMLENSPAFGPTIIGGLSAQTGLTQQDAGLQTYLNVLQHAIDSVDPVNFVADLQNAVISEVEGDTTTINDGRVNNLQGFFPGVVAGQTVQVDMDSSKAPLSGSTPLSELMGANRLTSGDVLLPAFVRFTDQASHVTPVLPDPTNPLAQATFGQMVAQTLSLISLNDFDSVAVVENGTEVSVIAD
ncbi:MAG: hypothetical protein LPK13_04755 [Marinobacter sp.]|uniref:hypothetical protein n=1 Tax=Marinobacter sp. TaxID=50741 RepID=UPI0029C4B817|nr:hypothetical protein [Marinobacter sp.]MDX5335383.1 hypothetical protein [Marinobacter sp.]MDX5386181.1 hypothetical protein [Marinobacter sp.]MDX5440361.1 hypothetical protein [Alteromonadaceae bacterium]MDX5471689.1 hypothetical protein [Marinobacter sp.]